jgi:hypothetical protein
MRKWRDGELESEKSPVFQAVSGYSSLRLPRSSGHGMYHLREPL